MRTMSPLKASTRKMAPSSVEASRNLPQGLQCCCSTQGPRSGEARTMQTCSTPELEARPLADHSTWPLHLERCEWTLTTPHSK